MAKPDGRIEKGQRLSTAISARAWNRAQDAADIVLGVRPGLEAGPLSTMRLPCVKATLRDRGYFGEVRTFTDLSLSLDSHFSPSMPASASSIGSGTNAEQKLLNYTLPSTYRPISANWTAYELERKFVVCVGNDSNEYAISGLAITRVRVTSTRHRRARLPITIGLGHASDSQVAGCLDSAWWGPAQIVGYAEPYTHANGENSVQFSFPDNELVTLSAPVFYWALVHF